MSLAEFDELKFDHSAPRLDKPSTYLLRKARKNPNGLQELRQSLKSCTIYVGNLSFYTSEEQIYELFSKCGFIKRIIMGLDRFKFTPCGFCFIIYSSPNEALNALKYLSDTKLDDKHITIDLDPGFEDGRQFGRGKSGGQVSDELRFEFDASRGGFGLPFNGGDDNGGYQSKVDEFGGPIEINTNSNFNDYNRNNFGTRRVKFGYIPPPDAMGTFSFKTEDGTLRDGLGNIIKEEDRIKEEGFDNDGFGGMKTENQDEYIKKEEIKDEDQHDTYIPER
ncbi:nuclear cap-binding protein subunit CBC2 NDAI_0I01310 [Naumovozyma dairenensis CBS 421]|uniref:Nuclear cap-binding protein subunit 2 n=1 Tax=Naumovozyma dairenensis (strain ATCC 10597 / BCRC 20456 / CBS 421 / NBRC 0211 / NRRL Y-12639) TaxID=1071378 RepID=G0WFY9_NAUDC|nr:hypothetical protein NDAI_0I01310 [Naumovozyma dairenensis CBS 421]CCD26700.1 hypothetical protein NDAI_0I01310 [Naumovozyma dairenensis CBS 421]